MVMIIIAIVLAAAAPSMSGFARGRRTQDAALEMLAVLKEARTRAISEARIYRIMFPNQDQYAGFVLEGGRPVPVDDRLGKSRQMPVDTHFTIIRADNGPVQYLDFYPSGRVDVASIVITPLRGQPTRIVCDSPTEGYRIVSSEVQSR